MYGEDFEYAASRLDGTVIRLLDGQPIWVESVLPGMFIKAVKLSDQNCYIKPHISEVDLKPAPLGMCNYKDNCTYLCRRPMRRDWKQGLRPGNFISLFGYPVEIIGPEALADTITGRFPSFAEACERAKAGVVQGVAWNRHWGLVGDVVAYKGVVGVGALHEGVVVLGEKYQHLRESLMESI